MTKDVVLQDQVSAESHQQVEEERRGQPGTPEQIAAHFAHLEKAPERLRALGHWVREIPLLK